MAIRSVFDAANAISALGGSWNGVKGAARCPAHHDRKASLSFFVNRDGYVAFKCHAGCTYTEVRDTLLRQGLLKREDLAKPTRRSKPADDPEPNSATEAEREFKRMDPAPASHPYLKKKRIGPGNCRVSKAKPGAIAVPAYNAENDAFASYQFASLKGKRWRTGTSTPGLYHPIGEMTGNLDAIVICESFSTGSSIHEATELPVACAFGRGNLMDVAQIMRKRWGKREIIVAADNDAGTEGNPGLTDATKAARAIGAKLAVPEQAGDFNDLRIAEGLDAVRERFETASEPAETDEEVIERLSRMPPLEYEKVRKSEADRLGLDRVSVLDKEVERLRKEQDELETLSSSSLMLRDVAPWDKPVNGGRRASQIAEQILRYIWMKPEEADAVVLFSIHSHSFASARVSPFLAVHSPTYECGKTSLLEIIERLVQRPLLTSSVTASPIFRAIHEYKPTLLVDEADSYERISDDFRHILNASHKRGGSVLRSEKVGDNWVPRKFEVFAPKAIALVGDLPVSIASRAIHVYLERAPSDAALIPLDEEHLDRFEKPGRRLARWAQDNADAIAAARPELPGFLKGRQADNWRHFFKIAQVLGDDWPDRARAAARKLIEFEASLTTNVELLIDIKDIRDRLEPGPNEAISSRELLDRLLKKKHRPWPDFKFGKPMSQQAMAGLLKSFKIWPSTKWIGGKSRRGYAWSQFDRAFATYIPPAESARSQESPKNRAKFKE